MVFCNYQKKRGNLFLKSSHNPYFSRWFSAIKENRFDGKCGVSHNPYFSRWFSAIWLHIKFVEDKQGSQSLF